MADYPLDVPGFDDDPLWLKAPLIGLPRLMQGTEQADRGDSALERRVYDDDGDEITATLKARSGGFDLPVVIIDDEVYEPTPTIPGAELALGIAPMVLPLLFGIAGAVMGVAAVMINLPALRSGRPRFQRIVIVIGALIFAIFGTLVLQGILSGNPEA